MQNYKHGNEQDNKKKKKIMSSPRLDECRQTCRSSEGVGVSFRCYLPRPFGQQELGIGLATFFFFEDHRSFWSRCLLSGRSW